MKDAWKLLTEAAVRAILLMAEDKNIELSNTEIATALREVFKEKIPDVQQEWKNATTARMNNAWLRRLLNTQASEIAVLALKKMKVL